MTKRSKSTYRDWEDIPVWDNNPNDVYRVSDSSYVFRVKPKEIITKVYMHYNHMEEFFNGIPRVKTDLHLECSSCGHKKDIHLEGIQSFF